MPLSASAERRLLQVAIAIGCVVPIGGGLMGIADAAGMAGHAGAVTLDSHFRYLSGLLLGIGVGFVSVIPRIEAQSARLSLLSAIVVTGGVARLYSLIVDGWPAPLMVFALVMELGVVPMLYLWHRARVALPA